MTLFCIGRPESDIAVQQCTSLIVVPLRTESQQFFAAKRGTVSVSFKNLVVTWPMLVRVSSCCPRNSLSVCNLSFSLALSFFPIPALPLWGTGKSSWVPRQREGRGVKKELRHWTDDTALDKKEVRTRESEHSGKIVRVNQDLLAFARLSLLPARLPGRWQTHAFQILPEMLKGLGLAKTSHHTWFLAFKGGHGNEVRALGWRWRFGVV